MSRDRERGALGRILARIAGGAGGDVPPRSGSGQADEPDLAELARRAGEFRQTLLAAKAASDPGLWYPYDSLGNIEHLDRVLTGEWRSLHRLAGGRPVADIGAADGDLAFFLESTGLEMEIIDHAPTNFNQLEGARRLKGALGSRVSISDVDLDSQFRLPHRRYGLVLLLGILYHLQNPFYVLSQLSKSTTHCLLSTRVARESTDHTVAFGELPVAYLVGPTETNNDATNYWIFSPAGLRRILERTGWEIVTFATVGPERSDPATAEGDERAFCALRSMHAGFEGA